MHMQFADDQSLLQAFAPRLSADNLVLALVKSSTSAEITADMVLETTIRLPISAAAGSHVAVAVEAHGLDSSIWFWGTLRVLQFFLMLPPEQWPTSVDHLTVPVRKKDCTLGPVIPVDAPTLAQAYELPAEGQPLSSLFPSSDFTIDCAHDLLMERAAWYKNPASAPPLLLTADDIKKDRLSYTLSVCAVMRTNWADRIERTVADRVVTRWMRSEMLIAIHRLRLDHIPLILAPLGFESDVPDGDEHEWMKGMRYGLPTLDAMDMLPMCRGDPETCYIKRDPLGRGPRIVTRDLFWWARSALRRIEANHKSNLAMIRRLYQSQSAGVRHLSDALTPSFLSFAAELRSWSTPPVCQMRPPVKKHAARTSLQDGMALIPIKSLDEFRKLMPGCMRELSDRAFLPHVQPHLKYEDRTLLYEHYMANGMDPAVFTDAVVAKFQGTDYHTRKLVQAVKAMDTYVQSSKFGLGRGCAFLQAKGLCPFYEVREGDNVPAAQAMLHNQLEARKRLARTNCHANLLTLAGLRDDPDGPGKRSNFPLLFTQKVARLRADKAAAATPLDKYLAQPESKKVKEQ